MPIRRAVFWLLDLVLGVGLGLLLLEAMLHLNPGLLLPRHGITRTSGRSNNYPEIYG